MKKTVLTLIAGAALFSAGAQTKEVKLVLSKDLHCGFDQVISKTNMSYLDLLAAYRATADANPNNMAAKGSGVVYDLPIVFHVVYPANAPTLNIPDSVIMNQLDVLNKAYRHRHADTANARSFFKSLAGDAEIQFHLATTDPQGNPTNGIDRKVTTRAYFGSSTGSLDSLERIKSAATGGVDPWPGTKYVNIWIGNLVDAQGQLSVLGYAVPPLNPIPSNWPAGSGAQLAGLKDGVVLQTHSVGSNSSLNSALQGIYTKGRCAVHEVGHYLGLQHVFGSNGAGTPSCGVIADDGIGDTPTQSTNSFDQNQGVSCPSATKNTCGAGVAGDLPDMWEDYMDYAHDACQMMFTHNQITVMRGVMANQRNSLVSGNSNGIANTVRPERIALYPNPAKNQLMVLYGGTIKKVTITNYLGQQVASFEGSAAGAKAYDISTLPDGNYILQAATDGAQLVNQFTVMH